MEAFADPVSLGMANLGLRMVDVIDRQEQLVVVSLRLPAVFRPPVRKDPQDRQPLSLVEREHTVIQEVGSGDGRLGGVQLAMDHLAVGVHVGLLVDSARPLEGTHVEGILGAQIAGMGGFDFAVVLLVEFLFLQRLDLGFR